MSIWKTFFLKFKSATKTLKKYLTNHINSTKLAFFPMKILVSLATSSVKIMNFSIGKIDMSMSFKYSSFCFFTTIKLCTSMKRQPIFNKLTWQEVFNCQYMQPTQIRKELFLQSTCRHLFYYGGLLISLCLQVLQCRHFPSQETWMLKQFVICQCRIILKYAMCFTYCILCGFFYFSVIILFLDEVLSEFYIVSHQETCG